MAEPLNGLLQAWLQNVQLQFDHVDSSLNLLNTSVSKMDDRLKVVEICVTKLEVLQTQQNKVDNIRHAQQEKVADRHEEQIEKGRDYYIALLREWGPPIAVVIYVIKDLVK